jgi:amino acid transporter
LQPDKQEAAQHLAESGVEIMVNRSLFDSIKPRSGFQSDANFIKLVIAPFVTLLNIGALYTIFASGTLVAIYVAISVILAQVFSPLPYLFTAAKVGYLSTDAFVGDLVACLIIAAITDPMIKYCSQKNHGI